MGSLKSSNSESKHRGNQTKRNVKAILVSQENKYKTVCPNCKEGHRLMDCDSFRSIPPVERRKVVSSKHLCFNCFANHHVQKCRSTYRCQQCSSRYHTLLHINNDLSKSHTNSVESTSGFSTDLNADKKSESKSCANVGVSDPSTILNANLAENFLNSDSVLLTTAWIHVQAENDRRVPARALIHQGAQSFFISEELCQNLKLHKIPYQGSERGKHLRVKVKSTSRYNLTLSLLSLAELPRS